MWLELKWAIFTPSISFVWKIKLLLITSILGMVLENLPTKVYLHLSANLTTNSSFLKIIVGWPCLVVILEGEMEIDTSFLAWFILSLLAKDWITVGGEGSLGYLLALTFTRLLLAISSLLVSLSLGGVYLCLLGWTTSKLEEIIRATD